MAIIKISKAEFLYSTPSLSLMRDHGPEVVFLGRSNTGKSSLINALCQKKDLARTSKTPGQTKHAVVYEVFFSSISKVKLGFLVDLPGFGYANMSKKEAKECEKLVFSYLENRPKIDLICLLLDIRRNPDEREEHVFKVAKERMVPVLLILTKSDQIALSKRTPRMQILLQNYLLNKDQVLLHSIKDKNTSLNLREKIFSFI